jgi:hypothetical protein
MNKKYVFARNINNSGKTGIVSIVSLEIMCYCNEEQSKTLLLALNCYHKLLITPNK